MANVTLRQIETLRHIYDLTTFNGFPPTINELRKAMGAASDQGVIEILQRLEDHGMIEKRTPGQARGLRLTSEAHLVIGVPFRQTAGPSGVPSAGTVFELSPVQQRIYKWLSGIDPKLARMYEGGLRVLLDVANPEHVFLSAHSIRESTFHLSNMGKGLLTKEEARTADELKASNARQLEKLFDPLGGTRHLDRTVYDRWNKEFHRFFVEVAHHGREITLEEYCAKLAQFEEFLDAYVLPLQTEIYARLDEQLRNGPGGASPDDLTFLLSRNLESYRYFFRKADARWLAFLNRHSLLSPTWEAADYFARIASDASEDVMAIIEKMQTSRDDWATRRGFLDAAVKMPPATARRVIAKMRQENWLAEPHADWLSYTLTDLFECFVGSGQHDDALAVATMILTGADGSEPHLKDYHLEQLLKEFSAVPATELPRYVAFLVQMLGTAIKLERPEARDDGSLMWRPAIEDHEQNEHHGQAKHHLVTALRDALSRYVSHLETTGEPSAEATVDGLLTSDHGHSILTRLRLHIYRQHTALFMPAIGAALLNEFDRTSSWHEYYLLLKEQFPNLSPTARTRWFNLLDEGPKGQRDERYVRHWRARRLSAVIDHLSADEKTRYQQVLPEAQKIEHPDFLAYMSGGWVGPTSPLAKEDLATMSVDAIIEHLTSWTPSTDGFSPSREGLGRELSEIVKTRPEAFSREAHRFSGDRIWPVYVYHLLRGLKEGLKDNPQLDWSNIVTLGLALVEKAETGALPAYKAESSIDAWEVEWTAAFQETASLLEVGMQTTAGGLPFAERKRIWRIIEFLCEHPEPTPEYEERFGGNNMEPFTLSINTARGRAFHALFAYIFWCDRHLGGKGELGSRISPECKTVLEAHLDPQRDPSLTVRSVYGHFFPWLFVYDPAWAIGLCERLFPVKDPERRYAAWETYLANGVFPRVYAALKPQYEQAISELRRFTRTRRYWADPVKRLADHMMIAYAYRGEDDRGATWARFFRVATPKQRGHAVSFAGRAYVLGDSARFGETPPDISRLQEFWEWRLADSKDREELQEFGWWVAAGKFSDEWMLERLIETLQKSEGAVEADTYVFDALSALAAAHPRLCGEALMLIVKSRYTERLMLYSSAKVQHILATMHGHADDGSRDLAVRIIDHLTKLGFEDYRHILENPVPVPGDPMDAGPRRYMTT